MPPPFQQLTKAHFFPSEYLWTLTIEGCDKQITRALSNLPRKFANNWFVLLVNHFVGWSPFLKKIFLKQWSILFYFRTMPEAYEGSQARGWIVVAAAGLYHSHSNRGSQPHLHPTPQLMATPDQILNPVIEARDWTCIFMDSSQVRFCWATRTPMEHFMYLIILAVVCSRLMWDLSSRTRN